MKRVATVLNENTRASDISGRIGGDEFLYIVSHVQEKHIHGVVDRLRGQIASQNFCFGGKSLSVTASIGVCGFHGAEFPEFSKLVHQADMALYAAKRAGRNQVKVEIL